MKPHRTFLAVLAAASFGAVPAATAQSGAPGSGVPESSPVEPIPPSTPSATLRIETTSIAAGIGVKWGRGTLLYDGQTYFFEVSGLSVLDVGLSRVEAVGDVFGMSSLDDFEGQYHGVDVGIAVGGGAGGVAMRNQNQVFIRLRSVQQGVRLSLATKGMTITLRRSRRTPDRADESPG